MKISNKQFLILISIILISTDLLGIITCFKLKNKSKTDTQYIVNKVNDEDNSISEHGINEEDKDIISNNEDIDSFMNREESDLIESNSSSIDDENNYQNNQLHQDNHLNNRNEIQSSDDSDLVENSHYNKNDSFSKENNNNMTNFVELNPRLKKKGAKGPLPIMNNSNYAFTAEPTQKNEIQRAIQTAHSNKIANELLKRKINVSIPERIESSFKRFRARHGETQDDFTAFLSYLKDASERASIKMNLRKKMLSDGYVADKIRKQ